MRRIAIISSLLVIISSTQVNAQCVPVISSNPALANGCEDLTIQFTDPSSCSQDRVWDFGDGTPTTSVQNPSHTFSSGIVGDTTYTVELKLQDFGGVCVSLQPKVDF